MPRIGGRSKVAIGACRQIAELAEFSFKLIWNRLQEKREFPRSSLKRSDEVARRDRRINRRFRIVGQTRFWAELREKSGFSGAGVANNEEAAFALFVHVRFDRLLDPRKEPFSAVKLLLLWLEKVFYGQSWKMLFAAWKTTLQIAQNLQKLMLQRPGLGNLFTKNRLKDRFSGSKCRQVTGQRISGPNFRQESRTGF